jgi:four helix bundle protein
MKREEPNKPYRTFEDLEAYQVARQFRKAMYRVARTLPDIEKFGLAHQIRDAAISLTNNIAEGHGRYHFPDQIKFILQTRGSLEELLDDLNICEDENYLPVAEIEELKQQGWRTHKVINGYIRYLRGRVAGGSSHVQGSADSDLIEDKLLQGWVDRFNSSSL